MSSRALETLLSPPSSFKYDVFLCFRGEDTRKNFIDHLYTCLCQKGKDDQELERGKTISQELVNAIQESRILVLVFSTNFASCTWCMDELLTIWECHEAGRQIILPVFYDVKPSQVRKQQGGIGKSFSLFEELYKKDNGRVQKWRDAMMKVANLSGWDLQDRHESKFIQDIIEDILRKLRKSNHKFSSVINDLVGINSRFEEIKKYLGIGKDDTRMIGISGMGGIGKTTLARVVFENMSFLFDGSSFLANVRETHNKHDIVSLQEQLLHDILMERKIKIWDAYGGAIEIRSRLCRKKVLIVIDDVDQLDQLNSLAGMRDWFGKGSRILITTRDEHLLVCHGVDNIYRVDGLNREEALHLFCLKAFRNGHPAEGYVELAYNFVSYANGLPLAIDVLGSFLLGRSKNEWESAFRRLKQIPFCRILDKLRISFDGLEQIDKEMFLDIACFFKGEDINYVKGVLLSCGFYPDIGMRVLVDKSLISLKNGKVLMHDLLQEMGQEIVRQKSYEEPGKRSRLWLYDDLHHVLENDTGTKDIKGIFLHPRQQEDELLNAKAFAKMKKLRLLKIQYLPFSENLEYISNELRYLEWHGYPFKFLPSSFHPLKLVEFHMPYSGIFKPSINGTRPLEMLKTINLSHSKNLRRIPDFRLVPNLQWLILEGCVRLKKVHKSIGGLKQLVYLNLNDCKKLSSLPNTISNSKSLKYLLLSNCFKLDKLPERMGDMVSLELLHMKTSNIQYLWMEIKPLEFFKVIDLSHSSNLIKTPNFKDVPNLEELILEGCVRLIEVHKSIGLLNRLTLLKLKDCRSLSTLPNGIFHLKSLRILNLHGCSNLGNIPLERLATMTNMEELDVGGIMKNNSIPWTLKFPSLSTFHCLRNLDLSYCNIMEDKLPKDLGSLPALRELNLSGNHFTSIPQSIIGLPWLTYFWLTNCSRLKSLPVLPPSIMYLSVDGCTSLKSFPNPFARRTGTFLNFTFVNCFKLTKIQGVFQWVKGFLRFLRIRDSKGLYSRYTCFSLCLPGSGIPRWFNYQGIGSSLRIQLPPNWCNDKWEGLFVCAVLGAEYDTEPDTFMFDCDVTVWHDSDEQEMGWGIRRRLSKDISVVSDHFWFKFTRPDDSISIDTWNSFRHMKVSVTQFSAATKVKYCGIRIVYQEDVEELMQCSSFSKSFGPLQNYGNLVNHKRDRSDDWFSTSELEFRDGVYDSKRLRILGESQYRTQ